MLSNPFKFEYSICGLFQLFKWQKGFYFRVNSLRFCSPLPNSKRTHDSKPRKILTRSRINQKLKQKSSFFTPLFLMTFQKQWMRDVEATNVTLFKFIHWHPEFKILLIQNFHFFFHSSTRFQFSALLQVYFRDSPKSSLKKKGEKEKTQHEIQIKSFQNSPLHRTQQVFRNGVDVFLKWLMGMKSFFPCWHMCFYIMCLFHFILMSRQKLEPSLPFTFLSQH